MDSYVFPPGDVRVEEVVLVESQRGAGELRRSVLQVWTRQGEMIAEHDRIHADPVYPAYFLRDRMPDGWLEIMGKGGDAIDGDPLPGKAQSAAPLPTAIETAAGEVA